MTDLTHVSVLGDQFIKGLEEKQKDPEKHRPIRTALHELDRRISGIVEAMYVGIGGPSKVGKTAVAQHVTTVISTVGRGKVGYFMLEEIAAQMAARSLARISPNVDRNMMYNLNVTEEGFLELWKANKMLEQEANLFIGDVYFTADEIIKAARENELKFVTVDYLQLMTDPGIHNESERLASISRKFVKSRNEDGITYIVVYQLNENNKALGSRTIYRDADLLLEVYPTKDDETGATLDGKLDIEVMPSRMCRAAGRVTVDFSGAHSRVSNQVVLDVGTMEILGDENAVQPEPPEEDIDPSLQKVRPPGPRLFPDDFTPDPEENEAD